MMEKIDDDDVVIEKTDDDGKVWRRLMVVY